MKQIEENYQRITDDKRLFDIRFWQSQGDLAIFNAVTEMINDYLLIRDLNANESDLIRSKEASGRLQDKIDVEKLKEAEKMDKLDKNGTKTLKTGDMAPDFTLEDADGKLWRLSDTAGKWRVLYFYPKDNTSGCTTEALDFTSLLPDFTRVGAIVIGVSADSVSSHQKFIKKHGLEVSLLSDPEHQVLEAYGVWAKKKMAGREYMGIVRSTFLIGADGIIRKIWPKVSVKGHAAAVLQALLQADETSFPSS